MEKENINIQEKQGYQSVLSDSICSPLKEEPPKSPIVTFEKKAICYILGLPYGRLEKMF